MDPTPPSEGIKKPMINDQIILIPQKRAQTTPHRKDRRSRPRSRRGREHADHQHQARLEYPVRAFSYKFQELSIQLH